MQYSSGTGAKCQIIRLHYRHCGSERSVAVTARYAIPLRRHESQRRGLFRLCGSHYARQVWFAVASWYAWTIKKSAPESIKMNCCPEIWFSLKPVRAKVVYMLVFTIQIMSLFMPLPVVAWCVHRWIMCTGEKKTSGRHGEFNLADDINFIVYFNISPVELMTSVVIIYNDITVAFTNVLLLKRACSRPVKSTRLNIGL